MPYRITIVVPNLKHADAIRAAAGPHSLFQVTDAGSPTPAAPERPVGPRPSNPRAARDQVVGKLIIGLLKALDRPVSAFEIGVELQKNNLKAKSTHPACSRLVRDGDIVRTGKGFFAVKKVFSESGLTV
jgi:hypothetical protein